MSLIDVGIRGLTPEPVYPYRGPVGTSYLKDFRDGPFRARSAVFGLSPEHTGWNRHVGPIKVAAKLIGQGVAGNAVRQRVFRQISREMLIGSSVNMLPRANNRVMPSADLGDALGLPRPEIAFDYDDYTRAGIVEARKVQDSLAAAMGLTETEALGPIPGSAVMAGTTRMGSDPMTAVVDADLRPHDHPNLYVVGASTFPTSSVFPRPSRSPPSASGSPPTCGRRCLPRPASAPAPQAPLGGSARGSRRARGAAGGTATARRGTRR